MNTLYENRRGQLPKSPKKWLITGVADMLKEQSLLGFAPTHRLAQCLAEAMPWYVGREE